MTSMKTLRDQRHQILWTSVPKPEGGWVSYHEKIASPEFLAIQAQIDEKEAIRKAKPFVLPDLTAHTAVAHMLQLLWAKGTMASNDFSQEHELWRSKGKSAVQVYGRHKNFDRFEGHLLERIRPENKQTFYYKWIGPKTKAEWIARLPIRRVTAWILHLENKIDQGFNTTYEERQWYAALCDKKSLLRIMKPCDVDSWFQELESRIDNLSPKEMEWLEELRKA